MFDMTTNTAMDTTGTIAPVPFGTGQTTVKRTSRACRIWLENKSLLERAGFAAEARYSLSLSSGRAVLTLDSQGKGRVSSCRRGDTVRPIIDLHNAAVAQHFVAGSVVQVEYRADTISITTI
jgi:hypothetical protein